jgi:hypothetical protein
MGEAYAINRGKNLQGRNHLGLRCRWEYNIKMAFKKIIVAREDLIHLPQSRGHYTWVWTVSSI